MIIFALYALNLLKQSFYTFPLWQSTFCSANLSKTPYSYSYWITLCVCFYFILLLSFHYRLKFDHYSETHWHCASLYLTACLKSYSTMCRQKSLKAFYQEKAETSSKHGPDLSYIYSTRMDFNICWKSLELLSTLRRQQNFCCRFVLLCVIVRLCMCVVNVA